MTAEFPFTSVCVLFVVFLYYDVPGYSMGKNVLTALEHFSVQTSCYSLLKAKEISFLLGGQNSLYVIFSFQAPTPAPPFCLLTIPHVSHLFGHTTSHSLKFSWRETPKTLVSSTRARTSNFSSMSMQYFAH